MVAREIGVNGNGLTDCMTGRTTGIHSVTHRLLSASNA